MLGPGVELLEVVRCIDNFVRFETEPADVLKNAVRVRGVFGLWIGVVKAELAHTIKLIGKAEVDADGFGVADMQIAVGLRWKTRLDATAEGAFCVLLLDLLPNEIGFR